MTSNQGTLDDVYFEWLYNQVASSANRNPARSYWKLCRQLFTKEFIWFVPNDDNRAEDGKELRTVFLDETGVDYDDPYGLWLDIGCSVLEMLIALSQAAAFETDRLPLEWFWRFVHNLGFDRYSDDIYEISIEEEVDEVLDGLNNRTYSEDGTGGIFPLRNATQDQRVIELWYQKSLYLQEGLYENTRPAW